MAFSSVVNYRQPVKWTDRRRPRKEQGHPIRGFEKHIWRLDKLEVGDEIGVGRAISHGTSTRSGVGVSTGFVGWNEVE